MDESDANIMDMIDLITVNDMIVCQLRGLSALSGVQLPPTLCLECGERRKPQLLLNK